MPLQKIAETCGFATVQRKNPFPSFGPFFRWFQGFEKEGETDADALAAALLVLVEQIAGFEQISESDRSSHAIAGI